MFFQNIYNTQPNRTLVASFYQPTQPHFVVRSCQNHGLPIPPGVPPPSAAALQATWASSDHH